ncbi:hypothetical protein [Streptomyces sp. NPDC047315]|uniref:hypothetical protein n=1 Tax=Streptomyces sp. NPDC047315 TaxID=3155142 RepID=UPI0033C5C3EA
MPDHDELVADRLRTAAESAARRARPADARTIEARGRRRRRRRATAMTGAGLLCAAVSVVAFAMTGSGGEPARPAEPSVHVPTVGVPSADVSPPVPTATFPAPPPTPSPTTPDLPRRDTPSGG